MLLSKFDLLATAPGGVARLRELILTLAVQGKLVSQDPADEPASELLKKIRAEKDRLIAEGKIKRDKPLAGIAEEEQPFGLPKEWEWVRLPEVTYNLGQGAPTDKFTYIDVAAIDNEGAVVTDAAEIVEASDAPSRARKNVAVGTVLYSTVRPYLKNIAVVEKDYTPRAIASTAFAIMHPHSGLLSKYLLHYLRSAVFTNFVSSKAVGVAYPAINDGNFFEGVIALPPEAEQSRIVTRVEELMRLCDALEGNGRLEATQHAQLVTTLLATLTDSASPEALADNWQRIAAHFDLLLDRPEAVDALEQTILQLAVRGLLVPQDPADEPATELLKMIRAEKDRLIAEGKIRREKDESELSGDELPFDLPASWEWVALGQVIDIVRGITFPASQKTREPAPGRIACLRTSNVQKSIEWDDLLFVDRSFMGREDQLIQHHDIVMSMANSRELVGKVALIDHIPHAEATFGGFLGVLRPREIDPLYAMAVLRTPYARSLLIDSSSQTTNIANVSLAKLRPLPFPLPPAAEQSRIVGRVEALRRLCADLRQRLSGSQSTQAKLAEVLVDLQAA